MAGEQSGEQQMTGTEFMTVQDFTNALQNIKNYIASYVTESDVEQTIVNNVINEIQSEISGAFRYAGSADSSTTASASGAFPAPVTTAYGDAYLDVAIGSDNTTPINQIGICLPKKDGQSSTSLSPAWHRILTAPLTSAGKGELTLLSLSASEAPVDVTTKSIVDRLNLLTSTVSALSAQVAAVYNSFCNPASGNPWFTENPGNDPYFGQISMNSSGNPQMWVPVTDGGRWAELGGGSSGWKHFGNSSANAASWAASASGNVGTYYSNNGSTLMAITSSESSGVPISNQWMTGGTSTTCNATSIKILGSNNSDAGVTITAQIAS